MKYLLVIFVVVAAMTSETAFAVPIPIDKAAVSDAICGFDADYGATAVAVLSAAPFTGSAGAKPTPLNKAWRASATHTVKQNRPCPLMNGGSTLFGGLIIHCDQTQMFSSGCCLKVPDPVGGATNGNGLSPDAAVEGNTTMYVPKGFIVAQNETLSSAEHLRRIFRPPVI